jgi:hypothetical protein
MCAWKGPKPKAKKPSPYPLGINTTQAPSSTTDEPLATMTDSEKHGTCKFWGFFTKEFELIRSQNSIFEHPDVKRFEQRGVDLKRTISSRLNPYVLYPDFFLIAFQRDGVFNIFLFSWNCDYCKGPSLLEKRSAPGLYSHLCW